MIYEVKRITYDYVEAENKVQAYEKWCVDDTVGCAEDELIISLDEN